MINRRFLSLELIDRVNPVRDQLQDLDNSSLTRFIQITIEMVYLRLPSGHLITCL